jgi:hypothetical protein
MNRNWDIFRNAANGADPSHETQRFDQGRQRMNEKATARGREERGDYVFDSAPHEPHHGYGRPGEWGSKLEGSSDYGWGARARLEELHGPTDEHLHGGERRGWVPSYGDEGFGRSSQGWGAQGYYGGAYARDDRRLAHLYDNEHDLRFDRPHAEHPSLWERVKGAFTGKGPKNWSRSDERIREDVCEALADHPYIDASELEVVVKDGEVTLTGTTPHRRMKRLAEDVAEEVRGIKDIHNQIRVKA